MPEETVSTEKRSPITVFRNCPECGGYAVMKSRSRSYERLLWLVGLRPARCAECGLRFYRLIIHPALRRV
jgi:DNA-directed RNA polymerase subunit RPC12/RpoP